jgi:predicted RNA-binding Zn ribbon-like protein
VSEDAKTAPGKLETVRAFINTLDVEYGTDELASPEALHDWLFDHGLVSEDCEVGPHDVAHASELREALRAMTLANNNSALAIPDRVSQGVAAAAERAGLVLRVQPDASIRLDAAAPGASGALGRLLAVVYDAMGEGSWRRLKLCRNDTCQWAFYDHSKNRSGHWCSMEECGNQVKARAYRARRKVASAGES